MEPFIAPILTVDQSYDLGFELIAAMKAEIADGDMDFGRAEAADGLTENPNCPAEYREGHQRGVELANIRMQKQAHFMARAAVLKLIEMKFMQRSQDEEYSRVPRVYVPYPYCESSFLLGTATVLSSGCELTINKKEGTAIINKWTGGEPRPISISWAESLVALGFLQEDSGNLDNGDVHYVFNYDIRKKLRRLPVRKKK